MITSPAYATLEMYNFEMNCPVDSFDFAEVFAEFDFVEMCEVQGNLLNMYQQPLSGSQELNSEGGTNHLIAEELAIQNTPLLTNQMAEVQLTPQTPPLTSQLDNIFGNLKGDLINQIQELVKQNLAFKENISVIKLKIKNLIDKLKQNLLTADQSGISGKVDEIITEQEIDKIIKDVLSAQFILYAYGDSVVIKDEVNGLEKLLDDYGVKLKENQMLQNRYNDLVKSKEKLDKNLMETDRIIAEFKMAVKEAVDKGKEIVEKTVEKVKEIEKSKTVEKAKEKVKEGVDKGKETIEKRIDDMLNFLKKKK